MPADPGDLFRPSRALVRPHELPTPIIWSQCDAADHAHLLEELSTWVYWLAERYRLDHRTVPHCWHKHPELLEELAALHLAWQGAYATSAPTDAPLHWHEHFAAASARLADWVARTGCRPDEHRPRAHTAPWIR